MVLVDDSVATTIEPILTMRTRMNRWCYLDLSYYKYKLSADFEIDLTMYDVEPETIKANLGPGSIKSTVYEFSSNGKLLIRKGYAWDGPSGPTIDTDTFMRGSLVHDCLYQMMRAGQLNLRFRKSSDLVLQKICKEDGMMWIRAWWVHKGLQLFGEKNARPNPVGTMPGEVCLNVPLS